jgi:ATP-dependent Lon protease
MPGGGKLLLTGSLGEVMKESAQTALTYLRGQSKLPDLDLHDTERTDIHIHVPAGATPKDGPSAGITIVVALASLLTKRKVRSDFAMTGEISLRGRVLPVGGVKEKILAANRAGIRHVILPEENEKDWIEIPNEVRRRVTAHFVRRIDEVFSLALRPR